MEVEKKQLQTFYDVLKGTEGILNLADSRLRDKFMDQIAIHAQTYAREKDKVYIAFARKKDDGTVDIINNQYHFDPADVQKVNEELITLSNEKVELTGVNKIKDFIEVSEYKPKAGEAGVIDELLSKL